MIGDITVVSGDDNTKVAFKNCHPFTRPDIKLNDEGLNTCENLDLIMNMYNSIEYSDNILILLLLCIILKDKNKIMTNLGS